MWETTGVHRTGSNQATKSNQDMPRAAIKHGKTRAQVLRDEFTRERAARLTIRQRDSQDLFLGRFKMGRNLCCDGNDDQRFLRDSGRECKCPRGKCCCGLPAGGKKCGCKGECAESCPGRRPSSLGRKPSCEREARKALKRKREERCEEVELLEGLSGCVYDERMATHDCCAVSHRSCRNPDCATHKIHCVPPADPVLHCNAHLKNNCGCLRTDFECELNLTFTFDHQDSKFAEHTIFRQDAAPQDRPEERQCRTDFVPPARRQSVPFAAPQAPRWSPRLSRRVFSRANVGRRDTAGAGGERPLSRPKSAVTRRSRTPPPTFRPQSAMNRGGGGSYYIPIGESEEAGMLYSGSDKAGYRNDRGDTAGSRGRLSARFHPDIQLCDYSESTGSLELLGESEDVGGAAAAGWGVTSHDESSSSSSSDSESEGVSSAGGDASEDHGSALEGHPAGGADQSGIDRSEEVDDGGAAQPERLAEMVPEQTVTGAADGQTEISEGAEESGADGEKERKVSEEVNEDEIVPTEDLSAATSQEECPSQPSEEPRGASPSEAGAGSAIGVLVHEIEPEAKSTTSDPQEGVVEGDYISQPPPTEINEDDQNAPTDDQNPPTDPVEEVAMTNEPGAPAMEQQGSSGQLKEGPRVAPPSEDGPRKGAAGQTVIEEVRTTGLVDLGKYSRDFDFEMVTVRATSVNPDCIRTAPVSSQLGGDRRGGGRRRMRGRGEKRLSRAKHVPDCGYGRQVLVKQNACFVVGNGCLIPMHEDPCREPAARQDPCCEPVHQDPCRWTTPPQPAAAPGVTNDAGQRKGRRLSSDPPRRPSRSSGVSLRGPPPAAHIEVDPCWGTARQLQQCSHEDGCCHCD